MQGQSLPQASRRPRADRHRPRAPSGRQVVDQRASSLAIAPEPALLDALDRLRPGRRPVVAGHCIEQGSAPQRGRSRPANSRPARASRWAEAARGGRCKASRITASRRRFAPAPRRTARPGSCCRLRLCAASAIVRRGGHVGLTLPASSNRRLAREARPAAPANSVPQRGPRRPRRIVRAERSRRGSPRDLRGAAASSAARRSGVSKAPPRSPAPKNVDQRPGAADAPPPSPRCRRLARRSSGSWPSGRSAKRRLLPGCSSGSARSTARSAARRPAPSPSKQRIGSSAIRQSSASWPSVSAVPSGATVFGKPAPTIAITST